MAGELLWNIVEVVTYSKVDIDQMWKELVCQLQSSQQNTSEVTTIPTIGLWTLPSACIRAVIPFLSSEYVYKFLES